MFCGLEKVLRSGSSAKYARTGKTLLLTPLVRFARPGRVGDPEGRRTQDAGLIGWWLRYDRWFAGVFSIHRVSP